MFKHTKQTVDRIRQFCDHQLRENLVPRTIPLATRLLVESCESEAVARAKPGWSEIERGQKWGPAYQEGWYWVSGKVPAGWGTPVLMYGPCEIKWESWGQVEGTVWTGGRQVGGLDFGHPYHRLGEDRVIDLTVQTYAHNAEVTVHRPEKPRTGEPEEFKGFFLGELDEDLLQLFWDFEFALNLLETLPEEDPAHSVYLRALNEVCNRFVAGDKKSLTACRRTIKAAGDELACEMRHTVVPVGHAHLDTAWLWPLSVTRLKMAHTTAIQLSLAESYPEHVFAHSQASQYEWLETEHTDLFDRVRAATKRGQWEPVGSMWVEADCNLTGGESLVRQFLYGRRYFRQKFGVTTEDMWLPDVFGYSAALPQILDKFGIKSFLTQKMSWNQTNKIPHNTFWWKGIDGSVVWTHFPPGDTYIADCTPKLLTQSVKNHRDKGRSDMSLMLYGFGDGGGGPTEWHLERLRRARVAPCLPAIESKRKARDFFAKARESSRDLMTWSGELYFEYHRGTYTSQAANKRDNRVCEFLLRDAEWLHSFRPDFDTGYPAEELERLWKVVLLNQFHDIIPGSSVREVYTDSASDYAGVAKDGEKLVTEAVRRMSAHLDTRGMSAPFALFHNAEAGAEVSFAVPQGKPPKSLVCCGERLPVQVVEDADGKRVLAPMPVSARGTVTVCDLGHQSPDYVPRLKAGARKLESDEWVVRFDGHGNITSVQTLDDEPIEFIRPGQLANLFQVLDDRPLFWDAWDTELYAQETAVSLVKSESFEVVEAGPVRAAVEFVKRFGSSTVRQRISLGPTPGIRFDTWVDWRESHKFLKVAFPLNVNSSRSTAEIQFGHVERSTHRNTSWDQARFETCCQKWVDMSEGGHGAALINTGKYGHDIFENVVRLSLLRSPKAPDPTCDMGLHRFTYTLLPHFDQIQHSDVVAAAYALNARTWVVPAKAGQAGVSEMPVLASVDTRSVVVEAVKKAEDSNHRIVRMYECHNTRGTSRLTMAVPVKRAWLCDLNETRLAELEVMDGSVVFGYRPFEILTVMVAL